MFDLNLEASREVGEVGISLMLEGQCVEEGMERGSWGLCEDGPAQNRSPVPTGRSGGPLVLGQRGKTAG